MKLTIQKKRSTERARQLVMFALLLIQAVFFEASFAQSVQPMVFELEPIGSKSSTTLRIENTQQQPLTVEMVATKITLDEVGNETLSSAEDDFLIYPPQTLIEKGKTQVVRVKYIGDPTITASQAYRVSVKQLPINLRDAGHTGVGMAINFNTLVNVAPAKAKAEVFVSEITQAENGRWLLTIENTGDRFSRLSTTSWEVVSTADPSKQKRFKSLEVASLTDKNLVVPHSRLRLSIPAIEGFDPNETKISIIQ